MKQFLIQQFKFISKINYKLFTGTIFLIIISLWIPSYFDHNYNISYDSYEALYFVAPYKINNVNMLGENGDQTAVRTYNRVGHSAIINIFGVAMSNFSISEIIYSNKIINRILFASIVINIFYLLLKLTNNFRTSIFSALSFILIASNIFYTNVILSDIWSLWLLSIILVLVFIIRENTKLNNDKNLSYVQISLIVLSSILTLFRFEYLFFILLLYFQQFISKKNILTIILFSFILNIIGLFTLNGPSWFIFRLISIDLLMDDIIVFSVVLCSIFILKSFYVKNALKFLILLMLGLLVFYFSTNLNDEKNHLMLFLVNSYGLLIIIAIEIFLSLKNASYKLLNMKPFIFFVTSLILTLTIYHTFYLQHLSILYFFAVITLGIFLTKSINLYKLSLYILILVTSFLFSWSNFYLDLKLDIAQIMATNIPQSFINIGENKSNITIYSYFPIATYIYSNQSSRYIGGDMKNICDIGETVFEKNLLVITFKEILDTCSIFKSHELISMESNPTNILYNVRYDNISSDGFKRMYYYLFSKK